MRGDVSITQDVSLKLQIVQTVLYYISDADDTGEIAIAQHQHMAHAMMRHEFHHPIHALLRGYASRRVA